MDNEDINTKTNFKEEIKDYNKEHLSIKHLNELLEKNPLVFTEYPLSLAQMVRARGSSTVFNASLLNTIDDKVSFVRNLVHLKIKEKLNISEGEVLQFSQDSVEIKGIDGTYDFEISGYEINEQNSKNINEQNKENVIKIGDYIILNHTNKVIEVIGTSSSFYNNQIGNYIPLKRINRVLDQTKICTLFELDLLIAENSKELEMKDARSETKKLVDELLKHKGAEFKNTFVLIENFERLEKEFVELFDSMEYLFVVKCTGDRDFYDMFGGVKGVWVPKM